MMDARARTRQRRVLIGLALLFFAPLGLAFYLYYGHGTWHPGGRVNAGELVSPARPLPALALPLWNSDASVAAGYTDPNFLKGRWTFLYVGSGRCDAACQGRLYDTRQVRIALDRDMKRVQRVFIADAGCCDPQYLREQHPDIVALRASAEAAPLLALLPAPDRPGRARPEAQPFAESRVYLVDPLGNLMMSYPPDAKAKGMLEDMKRLLRLSSIG
jgi:cytochrome oxidase Cu insertion factor (SCO1/SenC/PrrC family)